MLANVFVDLATPSFEQRSKVYALGELSSGEGAKLLSLTRREFLDLLGQYNVSLFDNEMDLKKEAGNG